MPHKAIIWDMDGVIADTARHHYHAWQEAMQELGAVYTEADFRNNFGKRNDTIIRFILGASVTPDEIEKIAVAKEANFRRHARGNLTALPGVIALIKSSREHGFAQAIGSSAPLENIRLVMKELGIAEFFQAIVSGREVSEGKPSPLGFLLAAERLGVKPQKCIVIEDAVAGVSAAKRGGMACLAVTNTNPESKLAEADLVVDSLEEVTASRLEGLLNSN